MQALRLTRDTDIRLTLENVQIPIPPPGHLLVRIHASPIHPSDSLNAAGKFPYTTFPRTPGRDFSGTVVGGSSQREGQAVFGTSGNTFAFTADGFQAEYAVVPDGCAIAKPEALSFVQAATLGVPLSTAALVLTRASARKVDIVLVLGSNGAVGASVVAIASAMGCQVFKAARGPGADVDTSADPELAEIQGLTSSQGVDVIVDTVGLPALTNAALRRLTNGGRLAFIASPRQGSTALSIDMEHCYRTEKSLIGCNSLLYTAEDAGQHLGLAVGMLGKEIHLLAAKQTWTEVSLENALEAYKSTDKRIKHVIRMIES